jgi:hypothetical protein
MKLLFAYIYIMKCDEWDIENLSLRYLDLVMWRVYDKWTMIWMYTVMYWNEIIFSR